VNPEPGEPGGVLDPDGLISDVLGVCNPLMAGATPVGT